jgi:hypothetical protein
MAVSPDLFRGRFEFYEITAKIGQIPAHPPAGEAGVRDDCPCAYKLHFILIIC